MITNKLYPSLSEDGWVDSSIKVADKILSCFFTSDYSESYIYKDKISSISYLIQKNNGDMVTLTSDLRLTLNQYFSRYFNNVEVEAKELENKDNPSVGQVTIFIQYTDNEGIVRSVGKLIEMENLQFKKIIDINNG